MAGLDTTMTVAREAAGAALLNAVNTRLVVGDGGMGTLLQSAEISETDWAGVPGCHEILNVTRPDVIAEIHRAYLDAGAEAIQTNTFGANATNLADYGLADRIGELAEAGARIARRTVGFHAVDERWVLGSLGPGTKLPSLGQVSFSELSEGYLAASRGLVAGGVDGFLVETVQDPLAAKAAVLAARQAMAEAGVSLPIFVTLTVEQNGALLLGTTVAAAVTTLEPLGISGIGLNCATGPDLRAGPLTELAESTSLPLFCQPNAGLPEPGPNGVVYPLAPADFGPAVIELFRRRWRSDARRNESDFQGGYLGGCCGTTPEHIAHLKAAIESTSLASGSREADGGGSSAISSLYSSHPVGLHSPDRPFLIGERLNANGSKAFREALTAENWDAMLALAKSQASAGADALDICVDLLGRNAPADMRELVSRLALASEKPLMIDSTDPIVTQAGLEAAPGRVMVNSVNLEAGSGPDSTFAQVMDLVAAHGVMVVGLTIDNSGQARTADQKVHIATELIEAMKINWTLSESDIIIDPLTFPITTGQEETRNDAVETLRAISELRSRYPELHLMLGVSNVSFG
ncbi:MAG: homocysteine S-methyltransferase family protein, partial [Promicromonosporaceae bacterium]|nr:homocysteine S-methyltransferase family protein [Promicromonosporaceae bacterium]